MELPHHDSLDTVPDHLTTRAGLKRLGILTFKPTPVATVTSYGKTVFLYDLRDLDDSQTQQSAETSPRTRRRVRRSEESP